MAKDRISNILIVDDIPANLKVLGDILKNNGYKVRPVPNGALALQVAEKEQPDLILLDIMMPDMDGYEVCRRLKIKEGLKEIPVIFISALNETNDIVKALNTGGVDYINKPFQAEEVLARVKTHLTISLQRLELQKLNSDKDRFMSILAHDLKGPFNIIFGYLELLLRNLRKYDIDRIEKQLGYIDKSARNTYSLLDELLMWVRSQSGMLPFEPKELDFNELCNETIEILAPSALNKNISINNLLNEAFPIDADANMIKTVIRNLVSNALKFTQSGGRIDIFADRADDHVTITVSDTGIGMSPDITSKLFDITQKYSTEGTAHETGTGLGLKLCKEFVEKHEGEIWVESEVEKGSVFYVSLPNVK